MTVGFAGLSAWIALLLWLGPQTSAVKDAADRPKESSITIPGSYREWKMVSNRVVSDASHPQFGFHYVYLNEIGRRALGRKSNSYPEGTQFVMVFHEVKQVETGMEPGKMTRLSIMVKDPKAYPETGGWGFAQFLGDKLERRKINGVKDCWSCHEPKKGNDFLLHTDLHD